jgi:hypothetical protein
MIGTEPILVSAQDGQNILAGLAKVPNDIRSFLEKYIANLTAK